MNNEYAVQNSQPRLILMRLIINMQTRIICIRYPTKDTSRNKSLILCRGCAMLCHGYTMYVVAVQCYVMAIQCNVMAL